MLTLFCTDTSGLDLPRYKHVVQVIIGEMKGAGVRVGCKCLWDQQTDKVAQETFINVSIAVLLFLFFLVLHLPFLLTFSLTYPPSHPPSQRQQDTIFAVGVAFGVYLY